MDKLDWFGVAALAVCSVTAVKLLQDYFAWKRSRRNPIQWGSKVEEAQRRADASLLQLKASIARSPKPD